MKVLFDTSVLVAALVEAHTMHARSLVWLQKAKSHEVDAFICNHTLAELYAVLTTLPLKPRISPRIAGHLIHENVETLTKPVPLSGGDYTSVIKGMISKGFSGGIIYDALIAKTAQKIEVDRLLTLNPEDFTRIWPEGISVIATP